MLKNAAAWARVGCTEPSSSVQRAMMTVSVPSHVHGKPKRVCAIRCGVPLILPMWWHYRNPVSGRTPELFMPDCTPCELAPDMSMTKHGYVLPPAGPVKSDE